MIQRGRVLDADPDTTRQISTIGIMPDLFSVAQKVQRVLTLHQFLDQVGNNVRHGQAYIAAS